MWSHPSIAHSHYTNPAGKVFTLSPWPLDRYWEWTRRVDRDDYQFGGVDASREDVVGVD